MELRWYKMTSCLGCGCLGRLSKGIGTKQRTKTSEGETERVTGKTCACGTGVKYPFYFFACITTNPHVHVELLPYSGLDIGLP